jgi:hypothetical protein
MERRCLASRRVVEGHRFEHEFAPSRLREFDGVGRCGDVGLRVEQLCEPLRCTGGPQEITKDF